HIGRAGRFRASPNGWGEVALFSVAGLGQEWFDRGYLSAYFSDERPGGRASGKRDFGYLSQFFAHPRRGAPAVAGASWGTHPPALSGARATDAGRFHHSAESLGGGPRCHRRGALHQRVGT